MVIHKWRDVPRRCISGVTKSAIISIFLCWNTSFSRYISHIHWSVSWNTFRQLIFIKKCKVAIVYELLGQPTYIFILFLNKAQSIFHVFNYRCIINLIENRQPGEATGWREYTLAVLFPVMGIIQIFLYTQSAFHMGCLGLQVKAALVGLIYRKVNLLS